MSWAVRRLAAGMILLAGATACSSGQSGDPRAHACALVRYWADTSGTVSDPDTGATSVGEITDLARSAWPQDTGAAAQFIQLYDDLGSSATDTQYAVEAHPFLAAHCP